MSATRTTRLVLLSAAGALLVAGSAVAGVYLLRSRQNVTTSSSEALRYYRVARENEDKLYSKDASAAYAKALEHDPNFVMATLRLARLLSDKDPDRARQLVQTVSRHRDEVTGRERLFIDIVTEQMGARDPQKLTALYDEFRRRYPEDVEGYTLRGQFLMRQGKQAEAAAEYEKALAINPNYAFGYNMLGYHWMSQGDYAKSEECFKKYRFLAPDQANPHDSLGELYAALGRYDEAEVSLLKALSVKPDFFASMGHLGTVEVGRGNFPKAAELFLKTAEVVETGPMRFEFQVASSFCLLEAGEQAKARERFEAAASEVASLGNGKEKFRELDVTLFRAAMLAHQGEFATAKEHLTRAEELCAKLDPKKKGRRVEAALAFVRAGLLSAEGKLEEAAVEYAAHLEKVPSQGIESLPYFDFYTLGRVDYAALLVKLGRLDDAKAALAPILEKNPNFKPALTVLATIGPEAPKPDVPRA